MGSRLAVVALACAALAAVPSTAAAVTCDRVGAALIVSMDNNDIAGLGVSSGNIQVRGNSGQLVACSGTPAPTVTNVGAILVSNQQGATSGSVIIDDAGDFAPGAVVDGSDTGGTSEIEIYVNLHDASYSNLSIRDRGGSVRFGTSGINPNATPSEIAPDADIFPIGVKMLEGRLGTQAFPDSGVLGAQGGAGTGDVLSSRIELLGNNGNDELTGGNGDDELLAFNGNDTVLGLEGADTIQPGEGDDVVDGGPGVDKVDYLLNQNISSVKIDLADGNAQDTGGAGTDTLANVEDVDGTATADVLRGDGGPNTLFASNGDDVLEGRRGKDTLQGWKGEDSIDARDGGPDKVDCGDDKDKVVADAPGVDTLIDCEQVSFATVKKPGGGGGGGGGNAARTFGRKTLVSLRLAKRPLRVRIANRNNFRVVARVSGRGVKARRFPVGSNAARTAKLTVSKAARRLLARKGRVALRLKIRLTDPLGNVRTSSRRLTLRKRG
jgi:Ca2+-binding RTX toxin-like protein